MKVVSLADCIPFHEARKYVGETKCVTGKVLRIKEGRSGTTFFDFCEDYRSCPFTVVVFPRDLKNVGDVRSLAGKDVEIHGQIKLYDGRAEIILKRAAQFSGAVTNLPPLPKGYDVQKKGQYSAGSFGHPSSHKPAKKEQPARGQIEEDVEPAGSEQ
jgi:hypothetical protein